MSPVPVLDDIFVEDASKDIILSVEADQNPQSLPNFYPDESSSKTRVFLQHFFSVLAFREVVPSLRPVCSMRRIPR